MTLFLNLNVIPIPPSLELHVTPREQGSLSEADSVKAIQVGKRNGK